jgi:hypothetical protein
MRTPQITHEDIGLGFFASMANALSLPARKPEKAAVPASAATASPEPGRGFLDRLDAWFWEQDQRARESYLGKAKDVYDLEARIRDLERGVTCRFY